MSFQGPIIVQNPSPTDVITNNPTVAFSSPQTQGNSNIVLAQFLAGDIQGVTDTLGNVYTLIGHHINSGNFGIVAYIASNIKGGTNTVTVNSNSPTPDIEAAAFEVSGICIADAFQFLDVPNGTTLMSISTQTNFPNELMISYELDGTAAATGPGVGWTENTGWPSGFGAGLQNQQQLVPTTVTSTIPLNMGTTAGTIIVFGIALRGGQLKRAKMQPMGL